MPRALSVILLAIPSYFAAVTLPLFALVFGGVAPYLHTVYDRAFLLLLGAMSIATSIATPKPWRTGALYSDGDRWLRIVGNTRVRAVELALFDLVQLAVVHRCCARISIAAAKTLIDCEGHREQDIGHLYAITDYQECRDSSMEEQHGRIL